MPEEQPPIPESNDVPESESFSDSETEEDAEEFDFDQVDNRPSPSPVVTQPTPRSQTLRSLQQIWQTIQPRLRIGTVRLLKTTIQLLQGAVTQLEDSAETAGIATDQLPIEPIALPDWATNLWTTMQRSWQQFWNWWNGVLPKIRGILPAVVNDTLSDRALTGAIAGVLVLVLWTSSAIFSNKPPKQVAVVPPSKSTPAKPTPAREKKPTKPKNMPEVKVIPPPKPTPTIEPTQSRPKPEPAKPTVETPKPAPVATPTPTVSPTAIASPTPKPTPSPTPKPPPLKLTPEQTLIAQIQDQVAEVSNQYVTGLIQSVQANFRSSRLMVKVGKGWYSLSPVQQDGLANDILQRAQQLNFLKLEMVDVKGELLARSPVIGSEMVVLQRSL